MFRYTWTASIRIWNARYIESTFNKTIRSTACNEGGRCNEAWQGVLREAGKWGSFYVHICVSNSSLFFFSPILISFNSRVRVQGITPQISIYLLRLDSEPLAFRYGITLDYIARSCMHKTDLCSTDSINHSVNSNWLVLVIFISTSISNILFWRKNRYFFAQWHIWCIYGFFSI